MQCSWQSQRYTVRGLHQTRVYLADCPLFHLLELREKAHCTPISSHNLPRDLIPSVRHVLQLSRYPPLLTSCFEVLLVFNAVGLSPQLCLKTPVGVLNMTPLQRIITIRGVSLPASLPTMAAMCHVLMAQRIPKASIFAPF